MVSVRLRSEVIDLFHAASVSVSGITTRRAEMRLLRATDRHGLAYEWAPYRWQRLRLVHGTWHAVLPAPALPGVYQLQLRLEGRRLLSSAGWLLRVFPPGTVTRRSFPTAVAAVRDFVAHLAGDQVLVAMRRWPQARFDHRDPRLHRLYVIAYAPPSGQTTELTVRPVRHRGAQRLPRALAAARRNGPALRLSRRADRRSGLGRNAAGA